MAILGLTAGWFLGINSDKEATAKAELEPIAAPCFKAETSEIDSADGK